MTNAVLATALPGLLFSSETFPFALSLTLMVAIGLLEGLATLVGMGVSGFLDGLLPEVDLSFDADGDVSGDLPESGVFTQALGWLHVGRVPILVLVVVFLSFFGLVGLFIQFTAQALLGSMLPALLACVPAFFVALPLLRLTGGAVSKVLPKDETDAVSADSFIGKFATLGAATASSENPAQAKLRDQHGHTHYVLVEPEDQEAVLKAGTEVVLVRRAGARFFAKYT